MLARTLVPGVLAGVLIGQLYLLATAIAFGFWSGYPVVAALAIHVGGLAGGLDSLLALAIILLLGPLRHCVPLSSLVGGVAAAAVPLFLTFSGGWPRTEGGAAIGIGLSSAAFVAAALLAWPVLTGRPWLPPGLSLPAAAGPREG